MSTCLLCDGGGGVGPGAWVGVVGSETGEGRGEKEANRGYFLEWLPLWAAAFIVLVSLGDGMGYASQVSQKRGKGAGRSILQPLPAPGCWAYGFCLFWVTMRQFPFPPFIQLWLIKFFSMHGHLGERVRGYREAENESSLVQPPQNPC